MRREDTAPDVSPVEAPIDQLNARLRSGCHIAERIDSEVLKSLGVFVLKRAFSESTVAAYRDRYFAELGTDSLTKTPFHLTEVKIAKDHALRQVVKEPEFLAIALGFFGGRVGSDFIRIVKKDAAHHEPVFVHQDSCYQIGSLNRYSLFIALTDCGPHNGGLVLYPGTHHFGYLGDAGEIRDILPDGYPRIAPTLSAGDVLIMDSATWHQSPANLSRTDRVYLEVHIQDIDEPNTLVEICGERTTPWRFRLKEDDIFKNSRAQRLRSLYQRIAVLEAAA